MQAEKLVFISALANSKRARQKTENGTNDLVELAYEALEQADMDASLEEDVGIDVDAEA